MDIPNELLSSNQNINLGNFLVEMPKFSGCQYDRPLYIHYVSDLHLNHARTGLNIDETIDLAVNTLLPDAFMEQVKSLDTMFVFCGDVADNIDIVKTFFVRFKQRHYDCKKQRYDSQENHIYEFKYYEPKIIYILGNHEISEYNTYQEAVSAYSLMANNIGITLLECDGYTYNLPPYKDTYDAYYPAYGIIGGIGFPGLNDSFNADINPESMSRMKTCKELTHLEEQQLSEQFVQLYKKALNTTVDKNVPLICITHHPIKDWLPNEETDRRVVYINGHTHRNIYIDNETQTIYGDAQVGYTSKQFVFKTACIGRWMNPFADYEDGFHEVTTRQYIEFYRYSKEQLDGTVLIDRSLQSKNQPKLYMIKRNGFYGFFLVGTKRGTSLCVGGTLRNISTVTDIRYFDAAFDSMVNYAIQAVAPYRKLQESFSKEVQSLGLSGNIHGCIIDLTFEDHIMINPYDGSVTYYNSPIFGVVKSFDSLQSLLASKERDKLIEEYQFINRFLTDDEINIKLQRLVQFIDHGMLEDTSLINQSASNATTGYEVLEIKKSLYTVSRQMNQFQRLFTANILRVWDDNFATKTLEQLSIESNDNVIINEIISHKMAHENVYMTLVRDDWLNLLKVPQEEITYSLLRCALKQSGSKPFPFRSFDKYVDMAYDPISNQEIEAFIRHIPVSLLKKESVFQMFCRCDGGYGDDRCIWCFPFDVLSEKELISFSNCLETCQLPEYISMVKDMCDERLLWNKLLSEGTENDILSILTDIPEEYKTRELCKRIINNAEPHKLLCYIEHIPHEYIDDLLCDKMISDYSSKTELFTAIDIYWNHLENIPDIVIKKLKPVAMEFKRKPSCCKAAIWKLIIEN